MPGKARRKRGKHIQTRKPGSRPHAVTAAPTQVAGQNNQPFLRSNASSPVAARTGSSARPEVIQHPYIITELRTTGILTVVMIAILHVLYMVL